MRQMRVLVVCYTVTAISAGLVEFLGPSTIPQAVQTAYDEVPVPDFDAPVLVVLLVSLAAFIGGVAASIGLYLGRTWAPRLALGVTFATPAMYLLSPVSIHGMADQALWDLSWLLWGAILASAYSPQYKEYAANNSLQGRRP